MRAEGGRGSGGGRRPAAWCGHLRAAQTATQNKPRQHHRRPASLQQAPASRAALAPPSTATRTWLEMPEPKMDWLDSWENSRKAGSFSAVTNAASAFSRSFSAGRLGREGGWSAQSRSASRRRHARHSRSVSPGRIPASTRPAQPPGPPRVQTSARAPSKALWPSEATASRPKSSKLRPMAKDGAAALMPSAAATAVLQAGSETGCRGGRGDAR